MSNGLSKEQIERIKNASCLDDLKWKMWKVTDSDRLAHVRDLLEVTPNFTVSEIAHRAGVPAQRVIDVSRGEA